MAKGPQILTASRLTDGTVLYWTGVGWADAMAEAEILTEPDAAKAALEGAAKWVGGRVVINPYLFEVRLEDGVAVPVKEREIIRAAGPSIRRDLGKQADGQYVPPPMHAQVTRAETTPGTEKDPFDVSL